MPHFEDRLLTIFEVAEMLNVSVPTVRKWKEKGVIPYVKIVQVLRFRESAIQALIEQNTINPEPLEEAI